MTAPSQNPFDLSGRVAVVTGANRGLGLGIARGLTQAGAQVAIWARDEEAGRQAAQQLNAEGGECHSFVCRVDVEEDVVRATQETLDHFGRIDAGFANAGFGRAANALELELDEFREILATNLDGVFLCFREWGRHMSQREGGGKLVGISSISAIFGTPLQPHYAASKGGLEALARSFATRMSRYDVQVNAIEPGWIETDATEGAWQDESFSKSIVRRIPARRWGTPADLAGVCIYLASPASNYHTGDTLRVDGGYSVF
jgi:NAD(P)-dependent dehydrogenase (short-subunit alcohol dehydrogenase family)